MKKIKLFLYSSFFVFHFSFTFGQSWVWGSCSKPPNGIDFGDVFGNHSVASDASGNAYAAAEYLGELIFGADTLTQGPDVVDEFLIKYNKTGTVSWIKQPISTNANAQFGSFAVALDNQAHVYLAGDFSYS